MILLKTLAIVLVFTTLALKEVGMLWSLKDVYIRNKYQCVAPHAGWRLMPNHTTFVHQVTFQVRPNTLFGLSAHFADLAGIDQCMNLVINHRKRDNNAIRVMTGLHSVLHFDPSYSFVTHPSTAWGGAKSHRGPKTNVPQSLVLTSGVSFWMMNWVQH